MLIFFTNSKLMKGTIIVAGIMNIGSYCLTGSIYGLENLHGNMYVN